MNYSLFFIIYYFADNLHWRSALDTWHGAVNSPIIFQNWFSRRKFKWGCYTMYTEFYSFGHTTTTSPTLFKNYFTFSSRNLLKWRGGGGGRGLGEENHNQHGWDPCRISECFASQENTKAVATLKYFITSVKFCLSYFYLKSLW